MTLQSVCTDGSGRARRERDGEPRQSPNPIYRRCDRGIEGRLLERLKSPTQHAPHARSFPVTIQETSSRPSAPSSNGKRSACSSVADRAFLSSFRTNRQRVCWRIVLRTMSMRTFSISAAASCETRVGVRTAPIVSEKPRATRVRRACRIRFAPKAASPISPPWPLLQLQRPGRRLHNIAIQ